MQVQTATCAKCLTSILTKLLHKQIEDLRNRTKSWSRQNEKLNSQLREEDIEILNSQLDRQIVVVWIWCRSQAALEHIQSLYELNQLRDVFFENIQSYISVVINIDGNQFKKTVVVCPMSIKFNGEIKLGGNEDVYGVTKLRNQIYVLCRQYPASRFSFHCVINVCQDRKPFRLQSKFKVKEFKVPGDIGSSEKVNCLYVSDAGRRNCVWKITRQTGDHYKIIKWLTTDYHPRTLSVSNNGQLLIVNESSSFLMIYGSDAELIRSIQLPMGIQPRHAVETSIGNFIIIYRWMGMISLMRRVRGIKCVICELSRDGQMVIRRFSPSNETQELNDPCYLSLDSDDRVFVADYENGSVILLDSDLKWNRFLCSMKEGKEETKISYPWRFCSDEEKKQLIVGGYTCTGQVIVYTLSRK